MACKHEPHGVLAAFYFVSYVLTVGYLIMNLFVGIITTEMSFAKEAAIKQRKMENKLALATRLRVRADKQILLGLADDEVG